MPPMQTIDYTLDDFDYALPPELIAQSPSPERSDSRLLHLSADKLSDHRFRELPGLLRPGDVLVFNDTAVIKARLFGIKDSGGRVELLIERLIDRHEVLAHIRASHAPKPGSVLRLAEAVDAKVIAREDDLYRLHLHGIDALSLLERYGSLPLPPYISHAPSPSDERRYQTVYAKVPGAVAAPTAGLHFDSSLLDQLRADGVGLVTLTLHVGAGTFQPVRTRHIAEHRMHVEWFDIPASTVAAIAAARARNNSIVAVGTTSLRALESAALGGELRAGARETRLFITPAYRFRVVDRLITNFHLPKSTLLMLVSAFAGIEPIRSAYRHAISERYRFFSYGDAMLLNRYIGTSVR